MIPCVNIITSAAFVNQELIAEFGLLPPSFLPLGAGRLYELQVDTFRKSSIETSPIYITIPESFIIPSYDKIILKEKGLLFVPVPDDMPLGASVVYTINTINAYNSNIRILHGDTVLDEIPEEMDIIASHSEGEDYSWAVINLDDENIDSLETIKSTKDKATDRPVACGYFSFSKGNELVRALSYARGDFIKGINIYNKKYPMKVKHVKEWYDFGHIQTYFQSKRLVTTARFFNSLQITNNEIKKTSADSFKMMAEKNWLDSVPSVIRPYTARLLDYGELEGRVFYSTEYQYAPNLSEIYVFSEISRVTWKKIISSCTNFLNISSSIKGNEKRDLYTNQLMGDKTVERLELFSKENGFNIEQDLRFNNQYYPSLLSISNIISQYITYNPEELSSIMHGDFCFSNILYNSRNSCISVIDPRGYVFPKKMDIYGDYRYDIAKLSHSINGLYDFIIAGRYDLKKNNKYEFELVFDINSQHEWLKEQFNEIDIAGTLTSSIEIKAITISLFLSMLPLHSDRPDRQNAFIANALRLYSDFERKQ